ncbi:MAG: hypothetical protein ACYTFG_05135 [Planctomycetota bacterium]|jgi:hypothetical protein
MRLLLAITLFAVAPGICLADGVATERVSVGRFMELLPLQDDTWGDDWNSGPAEEPGEDPLPPSEGPSAGGETSGKREVKGVRIEAFAGYLLPFLAKGTEFTGGLGVGLGVRIPLGRKIPEWIRGSVDAGFISADEDDWEGSSTLILVHLDAGSDLIKSGPLRGGAFLSLGFGAELFEGEDTIGVGTETSETNYNGLAGAGLFFGFAPTEEFHVDLVARFTFPLGSRNVRGITLLGIEAAFVF